MWEAMLVGLIVFVAVLYAGWTLVPVSTRLRTAQVFATWAQRPGRNAWLARVAVTLEKAARGRHGVCSDCGVVPDPPPGRSPGDERQPR
jgi:hypothetical protein